MISWLRDRWYAQQRRLDVLFLWPACCKHGRSVDLAKIVFALHAVQDPAWYSLGITELHRRIDALVIPEG